MGLALSLSVLAVTCGGGESGSGTSGQGQAGRGSLAWPASELMLCAASGAWPACQLIGAPQARDTSGHQWTPAAAVCIHS